MVNKLFLRNEDIFAFVFKCYFQDYMLDESLKLLETYASFINYPNMVLLIYPILIFLPPVFSLPLTEPISAVNKLTSM